MLTYRLYGEGGKMVKDFKILKHGDKVQNKNDASILVVIIWGEKMFFAGERDMWPVEEFVPMEWEKI